jgi:DNA-binding CsgD family transcriptional regulator
MKNWFLFIFLLPLFSRGQNTIGLPDVINYPKQAYTAGLQNWAICQDQRGIIYVANNEGLLSFDGAFWSLYPLPNKTIVRSVAIGADQKIYVGGQDEIGCFSPDASGRLQYRSLIDKIDRADRSFGDVWDIATYKKDIFFRTQYKIFRLSNGAMETFQAPSEWSYLGVCHEQLYAHDYARGILRYRDARWQPLEVPNVLATNDAVTGIFPLQEDSTVVTTLKNGVYYLSASGYRKLNSPDLTSIASLRIYAAIPINADWMALATNNGGIHIVNAAGEHIQQFTKAEGLQNNNILSVFLDRQQNLWLGLDNGIDFIAYNSAIKRIIPAGQDGSGYTTAIYRQRLYAGTSGGLFAVPLQPVPDLSFSKGNFSMIANTTGQVWGLAEINGQLLMGHHDGAFVIREASAELLFPYYAGYWNFVPMQDVFPASRIIAGNYRGLSFFDYANNEFRRAQQLPGFQESSRFVALDKQGTIWVSHPYHGVYKLKPGNDSVYSYQLYDQKKGLPSSLNNHVYKIKGEILVATEKGVYVYDAAGDRFVPSVYYKKLLGEQSLRYLKDDTEGNTWFVHEKNLGVIDVSGNKPAVVYLPELNHKLLSGFEMVYPVDARNIFVAAEKGFFHINYAKYKKNVSVLSVNIRTVQIHGNKDSLLFGGYFNEVNEQQVQPDARMPQLSSNWRTIRFSYASPLYGPSQELQYSCRLKGFDDNWSDWSVKTEKEYTRLPSGNFQFEVRVRNNLGNPSEPAVYRFRVLPPWYQTGWAYFVYALLIGFGLFLLYRSQQQKFKRQQLKYEEEQKKREYLYQLELSRTENELAALRNEKLQAEIDFKNSELATNAMHLVQKGELIAMIKSELNQLSKALDNEKAAAELKRMIKMLGEDEKMDKDWEHFAQHFDKVHNEFVAGLKEKHPGITANEVKLCAYLRMNLSTKEIAQLMNISVRGVEISRYRLRKKLGLASEVSLFDYLITIRNKP